LVNTSLAVVAKRGAIHFNNKIAMVGGIAKPVFANL
jgi:hypothetical protein